MALLHRSKKIIPFIILFALLGMLAAALFNHHTENNEGSLVGEQVPAFSLPNLSLPNDKFTASELKGKVSLLNFWATWCAACRQEHAMLMKIKNQYHIAIYGILYRDNASDAKKWLAKNGNPYLEIGNDADGDVAIDFGIYGTPETYVISQEGKILYRHIGIIDQSVWDDTLLPIINLYQLNVRN